MPAPLEATGFVEVAEVFRLVAERDRMGSPALVEVVLGNGGLLTIVAGGAVHPSRRSRVEYRVMLDHQPRRFWRKWAEDGSPSVYTRVTALPISHHIATSGGIRDMYVVLLRNDRLR